MPLVSNLNSKLLMLHILLSLLYLKPGLPVNSIFDILNVPLTDWNYVSPSMIGEYFSESRLYKL
jgi:hypothetical protein